MAKALSENDLQSASGGAKIIVGEEGFDIVSSVPEKKDEYYGSQTDVQWGNGETDRFLISIGDTEGKKNFWTKNGIKLKGDTLQEARKYAKDNNISLK